MVCGTCGKEIEANSKSCPACGAAVAQGFKRDWFYFGNLLASAGAIALLFLGWVSIRYKPTIFAQEFVTETFPLYKLFGKLDELNIFTSGFGNNHSALAAQIFFYAGLVVAGLLGVYILLLLIIPKKIIKLGRAILYTAAGFSALFVLAFSVFTIFDQKASDALSLTFAPYAAAGLPFLAAFVGLRKMKCDMGQRKEVKVHRLSMFEMGVYLAGAVAATAVSVLYKQIAYLAMPFAAVFIFFCLLGVYLKIEDGT